MNVHQFIFFLLLLSFASCGSGATKRGISQESRDSMLLNEIAKQFDYKTVYTSEIAFQLKNLRKQIVNDTSFGEFHLSAFLFHDQRYPPFVIEVMTSDFNVVSYFSYTDEIYYLRNGIEATHNDSSNIFEIHANKTHKNDYESKINLDIQFNDLVTKLNVQKDLAAVEQLVDIIFAQLLRLESYDDAEIEALLQQVAMTDQLRAQLIYEFRHFCSDDSNPTYRFKAKEGTGGYWKLVIMPTDEGYKLKSKFFSDELYRAIFF